MEKRRFLKDILEDLSKKMVFIAGPRQCGKTTFSEQIMKAIPGHYYNWDDDIDRKKLLHKELDEDGRLWIFDELHKYTRWRNWLKGLYDKRKNDHSIIVTGSAKLDVYSRGGDSLQGRYFLFRLHPFTLGEVHNDAGSIEIAPAKIIENIFNSSSSTVRKRENANRILQALFQLGPFPEPFLSGSEREASRWRLSYFSRVVREEIRDLERVRELALLEMLFHRLPETVGSVLSLNSFREDLEVSFDSVKLWMDIFERMYLCYRIPPFGAPKIKAVKKEQKLYLWDYAAVPGNGGRFENMVASHLLRLVHYAEDFWGQKFELRYFRDVQGHEVDFIILHNQKPLCCIETKYKGQGLDGNLKYFLERVKVPYAFQLHFEGEQNYRPDDINGCKIRIMPASDFLSQLP